MHRNIDAGPIAVTLACSTIRSWAMAQSRQQRPTFFNLLQIQMPLGALTSIAHRITGMLLAFSIPFGIYVLDVSLQGPLGYAQVIALLSKAPVKGALIVLAWVLAHHLLAGIRHLLSDVDIGSQLPAARRTAWVVNVGGVAVALFAAGLLL
jgi:succinate dehydrogenase / fumarate reductase cytochrome b subunit